MSIEQTVIVLDAADMGAVSTFWAGVYGGEVDADDDWHTIRVGGRAFLAVQLAPDHTPPHWPDGAPQQVHLDLFVDDIRAEHERVLGLGARPLGEVKDLGADAGFQVYADPAGHPFCLCWG